MANPMVRVYNIEDVVSNQQIRYLENTVGSNSMAQQGNVTRFTAPYNPFAGYRSMSAQNLTSMGGGQFYSANWMSFGRGFRMMGRSTRVTTHSSSAGSFSSVSFSTESFQFLPATSTPNASTSGTAAEDQESRNVGEFRQTDGRRPSKARRYSDQCRTDRFENQQNTDDDDGSDDRMEVDIPLPGAVKRKRNETV